MPIPAFTEPDWLPAPDDLANLLQGQTIGQVGDATENSGNFGAVTGTFPTDNTECATWAIKLAYKTPSRRIGTSTNETLVGHAVDATLFKAAAHYVSQVYSDQVTDGQRSRAEEYWSRQYDEAMAELAAAVDDHAGGDEPGPEDNTTAGLVVGFFPPSRLRDCYGRDRIV